MLQRILLHPCTDGERFCFSHIDKESCYHLVVRKSQDCEMVGWATKSGQNIPVGFTVDGVECFNQVNEGHVNILVLFTIFRFQVICLLSAGASGLEKLLLLSQQ